MGPTRVAQIRRAMASWHGGRGRRRRSDAKCAATDCDRPIATRGLCRQHYKGWWKARKLGRAVRVVPRDPIPDFAVEIDVSRCDASCDGAWLAGLLEGEGTFCVTKSGELAYPVIKVDMCDQAVIRRAARILGTSSVWSAMARRADWRPTYATAVSGNAAAPWMRRLRAVHGCPPDRSDRCGARCVSPDPADSPARDVHRHGMRRGTSLAWSLPQALHELDARCREGTRAAGHTTALDATASSDGRSSMRVVLPPTSFAG